MPSGSNSPCRTQALPLWEGALTSHGERGGGLHFPHAVLGDAGVGPLIRARGFLNAQRVVVLDVIPGVTAEEWKCFLWATQMDKKTITWKTPV